MKDHDVIIVGIDPGADGAYSIIDESGFAWAAPMPMAGKEVDTAELSSAIEIWAGVPALVVIEKVHAMPGQGVVSMFTFGQRYGTLLGICGGRGWPVELVAPPAWKKEVLAGTKRDKEAAIAYCRRRFPSVDLTPGRKRKPHDGMADALCLAEFGRRRIMRGIE